MTGRTGKVRYFLPAETHMNDVGEEIEEGADEIIQTDFDYPMRNVYQVSKSAGLIAITGGDGTLEEMLPALIDYDLPVSAFKGSGQAAVALGALVEIFPEWSSKVLITEEPDDLVHFVTKYDQSRER